MRYSITGSGNRAIKAVLIHKKASDSNADILENTNYHILWIRYKRILDMWNELMYFDEDHKDDLR
jgi:hypothetical protein